MEFLKRIFGSMDASSFNEIALGVFRCQSAKNETYRRYVELSGTVPAQIDHYSQIPFLPVAFFKSHPVKCGSGPDQKIFLSSGTTGSVRSRHHIADLDVYRTSLVQGFERIYGPLAGWEIIGLMPSPAENPSSSLIFMVDEWIRRSSSKRSGFYLNRFEELADLLADKKPVPRQSLVIGLSYALLDFSEVFRGSATDWVVMETGGMKGRREEMVREELHGILQEKFGLNDIHSEYGMTELLSQAYSKKEGRFFSPPWMKILIRDPNDPFQLFPPGKTGCINIIDLANFNSCSFIATDDLGKIYEDGSFEVLGRFDQGDIRGCNLMIG
jgi:hypothetical protein